MKMLLQAVRIKQIKMNPLYSLDQETLLDALTEYYEKYRFTVENNWNQKNYKLYKDSLIAILDELERRQTPLPAIMEEKSN